MSFSVTNGTAALSILQSITASSSSSDLVSILYASSGQSGGDPVASLIQAERNQTRDVAQQKNDPTTKNEIDHFLSVAKSATSLKKLLSDPIAAKVFLTANGLGSQTDYTALAVKALSSDPSQTGNFASTLSNPAWLSTAKTYNFATSGLSVLQDPKSLAAITNGYAQVQWQTSLDTTTPGLSAALDFRNRASTFTTVDQILGDANVRAVVTGALGIPKQIAFQSLGTQEKTITDRLDISKLKDPTFVENMARSYLVQNASTNQTNSSNSNSVLSLLA